MLRPYIVPVTLRYPQVPAEGEDVVSDPLSLGQQPQECPPPERKQRERARSTNNAIEPLEKDQCRIPGEWLDRQREQRRLHTPRKPHGRCYGRPGKRKQQHRGEHLDAGKGLLGALRHARRDEPRRPVRRVVRDYAHQRRR